MQPDEIPRDATGDALRRVLGDGSDLSLVMKIDFHVAVPDEIAGAVVASRVLELGFDAEVVKDDRPGAWTVWCSRTMVPSHAAITAIERELDEISRPHGGHADGWGTFGNVSRPR